MKPLFFLVIYFISGCAAYAQKQANIWYFGDHAGIDFNGGSPQAITGGQTYFEFNHAEGSTVMCDSTGSMLFYSNGNKVWNRLHNVMQNGDSLLGSYSSSQAPIAVPFPGNGDSLFYLFTVDGFFPEDTPYNGLRYSVINMCEAGGLGGIVSQSKNILLLDSCLEKIAVAKHANGIDYWIVVHKVFTNNFYAYLISTIGISAPVITSIGSIHNSVYETIGQMKFSPDAKHLALACGNGASLIELFDFDNSNGTLSNFISLCNLTSCSAYGVAFSPDNSKLYISQHNPLPPTKRVTQYDLNAGGGHPDSISGSEIPVWGITNAMTQGGMQLGPDGKIYCVPFTSLHHLSVIHFPNLRGIACQYEDTLIYLLENRVNYTLPGTLDSYDYHNTVTLCPNGISEASLSSVEVFPNPVSEILMIKSTNPINSVMIFNLLGEKIASDFLIGKNEHEVHLKVQELPEGIYYLRILAEDQIMVRYFIKQ